MFWQNFIRLCSKAGKSPNRVASELGFSNAVATGWKKGSVPRDSTLLQIAEYFGVPVESLTEETLSAPDSKEPPSLEKENERKEEDELETRFMNAVQCLPLPQKIALVEILEAAIGNGVTDTRQIRQRLSASQTASFGR